MVNPLITLTTQKSKIPLNISIPKYKLRLPILIQIHNKTSFIYPMQLNLIIYSNAAITSKCLFNMMTIFMTLTIQEIRMIMYLDLMKYLVMLITMVMMLMILPLMTTTLKNRIKLLNKKMNSTTWKITPCKYALTTYFKLTFIRTKLHHSNQTNTMIT